MTGCCVGTEARQCPTEREAAAQVPGSRFPRGESCPSRESRLVGVVVSACAVSDVDTQLAPVIPVFVRNALWYTRCKDESWAENACDGVPPKNLDNYYFYFFFTSQATVMEVIDVGTHGTTGLTGAACGSFSVID